jgi:hypothetical protein
VPGPNDAPVVADPAANGSDDGAVEAVEAPVVVAEPGDGEAAAAAAPSTVRKISSPEPEPVDLVATAGSPVVKRLAIPAAVVATFWLLRVLLRRRR